jgi:GTP-binding protein
VIVFLVEAATGPLPDDHTIVARLRKTGKPVILAINKAEGRAPLELAAAFYELGLGEPVAISAQHGDRLALLGERILAALPAAEEAEPQSGSAALSGTRIAVIGRPNVGKSTLINRLLGEDRLLTSDQAGTTRDSIRVPFTHDGHAMVLVDTAGIRRKARVDEVIERFSIVKSLQALEEADAVLVLIDARDSLTEQDVSLIGLVLERGRALAIGVNKWDHLPPISASACAKTWTGGCRSWILPISISSRPCMARRFSTCLKAVAGRRSPRSVNCRRRTSTGRSRMPCRPIRRPSPAAAASS